MSKKVMNCPHCGKVLPGEFWHEESQTGKPIIKCLDVVAIGIEKTQKDTRYLELFNAIIV